MRQAAQAAPDGYTMTIAGATVMAISPHTTAGLGYDPERISSESRTFRKPDHHRGQPAVQANRWRNWRPCAGRVADHGVIRRGGIATLPSKCSTGRRSVKAIHCALYGGAPAATDVVAATRNLSQWTRAAAGLHTGGRCARRGGRRETIAMLPNVRRRSFRATRNERGHWYAIIVPAGTPQPIVAKPTPRFQATNART